jgi:hypothetical protein
MTSMPVGHERAHGSAVSRAAAAVSRAGAAVSLAHEFAVSRASLFYLVLRLSFALDIPGFI